MWPAEEFPARSKVKAGGAPGHEKLTAEPSRHDWEPNRQTPVFRLTYTKLNLNINLIALAKDNYYYYIANTLYIEYWAMRAEQAVLFQHSSQE